MTYYSSLKTQQILTQILNTCPADSLKLLQNLEVLNNAIIDYVIDNIYKSDISISSTGSNVTHTGGISQLHTARNISTLSLNL